jgi:hypothetical protein
MSEMGAFEITLECVDSARELNGCACMLSGGRGADRIW